jgi:hypothetical protein
VKKLALAVALLSSVSCSAHTPGTARVVRVTDQGGLIRLQGGDLDQAAQAAVKAMKGECGDRFTVTALDDPGPSVPVYVPGPFDEQTEVTQPVLRDLTYQCGGPGKASPLTVRVLSWAARADQADAERLARAEAANKSDASYQCDPQGECTGGVCIAGQCVR